MKEDRVGCRVPLLEVLADRPQLLREALGVVELLDRDDHVHVLVPMVDLAFVSSFWRIFGKL